MNRLFVLLVVFFGVFCDPPVYPPVPYNVKKFGYDLPDNYHYLAKNNKTFLNTIHVLVDQENLYGGAPFDYRLYGEYQQVTVTQQYHTNQSKTHVGEYVYWSDVGVVNTAFRRRKNDGTSTETVLNQGDLQKIYQHGRDARHVVVQKMFPSPDGKFVAFSYNLDLSERNFVAVIDMVKKKTVYQELNCTGKNFGWSKNSEFFLYESTNCEGSSQVMEIFIHKVGDKQVHDIPLESIDDETHELSLSKSCDGEFYFVNYVSPSDSYVKYVSSMFDQSSTLTDLKAKEDEKYYKVDHAGGKFFFVNNFQPGGENFEVSYLDPNGTEPTYTTVHAGTTTDVVQKISLTKTHLVVLSYNFEDYVDNLFIYDLSDLTKKAVKVDFSKIRENGEYYSVLLFSGLTDSMGYGKIIPLQYEFYEETSFLFGYTSLIQPLRVYAYHIVASSVTLLKEEVFPGYKKSEFLDKLILVNSTNNETKETVQIPMFVAHRKGITLGLYGYLNVFSSFGAIAKPMFGIENWVYMSGTEGFNFVYGIVNTRGTMMKGYNWWKGGKGSKGRITAFNDLEASLAAFTNPVNKIAHRSLTVMSGFGHDGGLVASVCVIKRTMLKMCVIEMGYVDYLNTLLDDTIPFVVRDRLELGDPTKKADFEDILQLDPYFNIIKGDAKKKIPVPAYPFFYFDGAMTSRRFNYWETLKFAARYRDANDPKWMATLNQQIYYGNYDPVLMAAKRNAYVFKTLTGWRWHDPFEWLWILISILVLGAWMLLFMSLFIFVEIRSKAKKKKKDYARINDEPEGETEGAENETTTTTTVEQQPVEDETTKDLTY